MSPGHHRAGSESERSRFPRRPDRGISLGAVDVFDRPIADRLPGLVAALGPLGLADLPTPVAPLEGLGRGALWIKRDDSSSELYGGNKVRKLEFLLGQARKQGALTLVTMGGTGSNHLLATALHGRSLGMGTVGVVFPQPETEAVRRNLAADRAAGVELIPIRSKYLLPGAVAWALARVRLTTGRPAALIPGGGSSPVGALGFVNAGLELAAQIDGGQLPRPEAVFLPYGTGGTAVGLAIGLALAGLPTRVVAVRVIDRLLANRPRLRLLARAVATLIRRHQPGVDLPAWPGDNLEIRQGYIGAGYGYPTDEAARALTAFGERAGIRLEATYTAKAAAAFLDEARNAGGPLLFWNTYSSANIDRWVEAGRGMGA
jgi:D-cysteine desulfhydrase